MALLLHSKNRELFAFILKQYIKFIATEVECSTYFKDGRNLVPRVTYSICCLVVFREHLRMPLNPCGSVFLFQGSEIFYP